MNPAVITPRYRGSIVATALVLGLAPITVDAQTTEPSDRPQVVQKLLDCRQIKADAARLACFDSQSEELLSADTRGDVKMIDRAQMTKTRRALFGLNLSGLSLFGSSKSTGSHKPGMSDELDEITSKVTSTARNADGGWILTLEDGARWEQTDAVLLGRKPVAGATVTIKRGALGSYKMTVDNGPTMRARRLG